MSESKRIIYETPDKLFRITEYEENNTDLQEQKDNCFGYVLEYWNPSPGIGYQHIDSCWGFIGAYCESDDQFNHWIVDEMKRTIRKFSIGKVGK